MTVRETIVTALLAALATTGSTVSRDASRPETVPAAGLLILREGNGDLADITLSPTTYHYRHAMLIELYAGDTSQPERVSTIDALLTAVRGSLIADRSLGGIADWIEIADTVLLAEDAGEGVVPVRQALVTIHIHYHAADALA